MDACCSLNPAIDIGQVGAAPPGWMPLFESHCGVGKGLLKSTQYHRAWHFPSSD